MTYENDTNVSKSTPLAGRKMIWGNDKQLSIKQRLLWRKREQFLVSLVDWKRSSAFKL